MNINFDKTIYDIESIQESLQIWSEYFDDIKIVKKSNFISVSFVNKKSEIRLVHEFVNYVLDVVSSKEFNK